MFKTIPLLRGFTEISILFELTQKNDCVNKFTKETTILVKIQNVSLLEKD